MSFNFSERILNNTLHTDSLINQQDLIDSNSWQASELLAPKVQSGDNFIDFKEMEASRIWNLYRAFKDSPLKFAYLEIFFQLLKINILQT